MARAKPYRAGALPRSQRKRIGDCDLGDRVELLDGTVVTVTAFINGGLFGRVDGGELSKLDHDRQIRRIL